MTINLFDALLRDVPRYEPDNPPDNAPSMQPANDGDWVRYSDVLAALAAAVPADLAEAAGSLLPTLRKGPEYVYGFVDTDNRAADMITALARIAAQEAKMKELEAEITATDDLMAADSCRIATPKLTPRLKVIKGDKTD